MEINEIKQRLLLLLQGFKEVLPIDRYHDIETTITYGGEWELALELLCENLRDIEVVPNKEAFKEIKELGEALRVNHSYWEHWNSRMSKNKR